MKLFSKQGHPCHDFKAVLAQVANYQGIEEVGHQCDGSDMDVTTIFERAKDPQNSFF
jgi:hypothetical protein